ncbi:hypothetical protein E2C01_073543 [Portunus trituberculatus]|uniref:Uncharacterized protein n=1 Tax=Portunus trituberculatus TaxID=210409 RepID=A0A5B7I5M0_PORTR|nr:hypothetical protein [Portunus trituberculatus]
MVDVLIQITTSPVHTGDDALLASGNTGDIGGTRGRAWRGEKGRAWEGL